jgi:hypothetical protein
MKKLEKEFDYNVQMNEDPNYEKDIDILLTPFLYCYNNVEKKIPIIINDFPLLKYRDFCARNLTTAELRNIFKV